MEVVMISSVSNSNTLPSFTQIKPQQAPVPKTGAQDSDGDNDGSKPGEVEQSEQARNNTSGNLVDLKV